MHLLVQAMDVVYFSPLLRTGGTQRHLFELCRALDARRFRLSVCCLNGGGSMERLFTEAGIAVRDLGVGQRFVSPRSLAALRRTVRWLRDLRPDVVHTYQCRPGIFGTVAAKFAGVPVIIVSKRSFDKQSRWLEGLWRRTNRLASAVLVNSEALAREAKSQGDAGKVVMIPCGVDTEHFSPQDSRAAKATLGVGADRLVVGSVGRMIARKGHRYLLEAAARLEKEGIEFDVLLVGDGPEREPLLGMARHLGLERRVHFLGDRPDVRACLAAMDVFVLPSLHEGMSNALLEAMAMAKPVVVTDGPGNEEVVTDGVSGLVVKAGDAEALATGLMSLIGDSSLCQRLGRGAREHVEARFSRAAMVERFAELYETLVGASRDGLRGAILTRAHLA